MTEHFFFPFHSAGGQACPRQKSIFFSVSGLCGPEARSVFNGRRACTHQSFGPIGHVDHLSLKVCRTDENQGMAMTNITGMPRVAIFRASVPRLVIVSTSSLLDTQRASQIAGDTNVDP